VSVTETVAGARVDGVPSADDSTVDESVDVGAVVVSDRVAGIRLDGAGSVDES
jgi:hypothetical protein